MTCCKHVQVVFVAQEVQKAMPHFILDDNARAAKNG
jgi:hypothetical protein